MKMQLIMIKMIAVFWIHLKKVKEKKKHEKIVTGIKLPQIKTGSGCILWLGYVLAYNHTHKQKRYLYVPE